MSDLPQVGRPSETTERGMGFFLVYFYYYFFIEHLIVADTIKYIV